MNKKSADTTATEVVLTDGSDSPAPPIVVRVNLMRKPVGMEVGTGNTVSIICK